MVYTSPRDYLKDLQFQISSLERKTPAFLREKLRVIQRRIYNLHINNMPEKRKGSIAKLLDALYAEESVIRNQLEDNDACADALVKLSDLRKSECALLAQIHINENRLKDYNDRMESIIQQKISRGNLVRVIKLASACEMLLCASILGGNIMIMG